MDTEQKIIKNKLGLLKLSEMLDSVSEAYKVRQQNMGKFRRVAGPAAFAVNPQFRNCAIANTAAS
jgi:hypothetical protein